MGRMQRVVLVVMTVLVMLMGGVLMGDSAFVKAESATERMEGEGLMSLETETPEEGFQLAITLSRKGVTETQPDREVLHHEREKYARDFEALTAASHVIAVHFQTIAAANDYWRD